MTTDPSVPHASTGPPAERLYAVDPVGEATITPSQPSSPSDWPSTHHSISAMRPETALISRTSLMPMTASDAVVAVRVGSDTTS